MRYRFVLLYSSAKLLQVKIRIYSNVVQMSITFFCALTLTSDIAELCKLNFCFLECSSKYKEANT